jgi:hypothetical protein
MILDHANSNDSPRARACESARRISAGVMPASVGDRTGRTPSNTQNHTPAPQRSFSPRRRSGRSLRERPPQTAKSRDKRSLNGPRRDQTPLIRAQSARFRGRAGRASRGRNRPWRKGLRVIRASRRNGPGPASHARGRWFETSRAHDSLNQCHSGASDAASLPRPAVAGEPGPTACPRRVVGIEEVAIVVVGVAGEMPVGGVGDLQLVPIRRASAQMLMSAARLQVAMV